MQGDTEVIMASEGITLAIYYEGLFFGRSVFSRAFPSITQSRSAVICICSVSCVTPCCPRMDGLVLIKASGALSEERLREQGTIFVTYQIENRLTIGIGQ